MLLWALIACDTAAAQRQSGRVYEFLNLPATARITALGGYAIPDLDNDLGMALFYPALINPGLQNEISLNFVDYFSDIHYGTVAFSYGFEKIGNLTFAINYISYGRFIEADEFGYQTGEFSAGEYAATIGWGRALTEKISIGSNLKIITSTLEQYSSLGLATDVSVAYTDPDRLLATSLVLRNMGRQITTYDNRREPLPFDIVLGASKKLTNAPLRFSFVAHNLHIPDLTYQELQLPGQSLLISQPGDATSQERFSEWGDKLLRHAVLGAEFIPSKNFFAAIGYNYRRRKEMGVDSRLSTVGLSWGIGVRVSHFMFQYGRSNYHLAGAPNHFSITTNLDRLFFRPQDTPVLQPTIREDGN